MTGPTMNTNKRTAPEMVVGETPKRARTVTANLENNKLVVKGAWSTEEDQTMLEAVKLVGFNWKKISTFVAGRSAKQCRDRYKLKLDPSINHGPWTPEEDNKLTELHEMLGRQWTKIAKLMPGRTENSVKSRYASLVRSRTREWTYVEDITLRQCKNSGLSYAEIAKQKLPHRSEHAVKKRWERLFMRDLAQKIKSDMLSKSASSDSLLSEPPMDDNGESSLKRASTSLAAALQKNTKEVEQHQDACLAELHIPTDEPISNVKQETAHAFSNEPQFCHVGPLSDVHSAPPPQQQQQHSDIPSMVHQESMVDNFNVPQIAQHPTTTTHTQQAPARVAAANRAPRLRRFSTSVSILLEYIKEPLPTGGVAR